MKKILVPSDFSFTSTQAYLVALQLARRTNAEVHVLKAIDLPFSYESSYAAGHYSADKGLLRVLEDDARKSFEELKKKSGSIDNLHFSTLQGAVTDVIRTYIENEEIDLVVMGTNGATGFREYLVGSNTEKIVRFSPVPVLAIRQAVELSTITDIVVPTDADIVHPGFISALRELQSLLVAELHLLLVSTDHRLLNSNQLMKKLDDFAVRAGLQNYTLNLQREDGKKQGIIEFTREINADMIAMATHGRQGLTHLF
ncbi:MAG TPA: universal stress protein, partial [Cyclobacteriaceae bacterium]|nr:universal stress protein [Cyclobacteriaceae bacterium]